MGTLLEQVSGKKLYNDSLVQYFDILMVCLFLQFLLLQLNRRVGDLSDEFISSYLHFFINSPGVFASSFSFGVPCKSQVVLNGSFLLDLKLRMSREYEEFKGRFLGDYVLRFLGRVGLGGRRGLSVSTKQVEAGGRGRGGV